MRSWRVFSALLSLSAVFVAPARAGDAALFYAPTTAHVPPIITDGPKSSSHPAPPYERVCFNPTESRERIATHKLAEPFQALRNVQGEALRAKLCRWKQNEFVYEVAVLRRDGRIIHVYMNAQNGRNVGPREE